MFTANAFALNCKNAFHNDTVVVAQHDDIAIMQL